MENNKTTGVVLAVVAVAIIAVGTLWFINRDDSKETAQNNTPDTSQNETQQSNNNIVVLATNTEALSTLVSAVKAAELVETLQGAGPFTVFAPTNDAFAALPAGTLDSLLKPENKEQLKSILTYHVVPGQYTASQLSDGQELTTVQGGKLTVKITDGKVYIVDAKGNQVMVEKADVNADNGVVHVIGGVLLPQ
jgi:uncharacterized surface protein with fasciclin (FAS1) repeats